MVVAVPATVVAVGGPVADEEPDEEDPDARLHGGGGKQKTEQALKVWPDPLAAPKTTAAKRTFGPADFHFHQAQGTARLLLGDCVALDYRHPLLTAMSVALPFYGFLLNTIGLPIDLLLTKSGGRLRRCVGLEEAPLVPPTLKLQTTVKPLLEPFQRKAVYESMKAHEEVPFIIAPVVQGWHNLFSLDLRDAMVEEYKELGVAPEIHGGGGCCLRAAYRHCKKDPDGELKDERPVLRIGTRAVLVATECSDFEACLMDLDEELMLMGHRFIDETQRKILGMPLTHQEGYWCAPIRQHLQALTDAQKETVPPMFQFVFNDSVSDDSESDEEASSDGSSSDGTEVPEALGKQLIQPVARGKQLKQLKHLKHLRNQKRRRRRLQHLRSLPVPILQRRGDESSSEESADESSDESDEEMPELVQRGDAVSGGEDDDSDDEDDSSDSDDSDDEDNDEDNGKVIHGKQVRGKAVPGKQPQQFPGKQRRQPVFPGKQPRQSDLTHSLTYAANCRTATARGASADMAKREAEVYDKLYDMSNIAGVPPKYIPVASYKCNLTYPKIGPQSSEGEHRDSSALLLSPSENETMLDGDGDKFPTLQSLTVNTWSFGMAQYVGQTRLYHTSGNDGSESILSEITLGNNDGHTQWMLVQFLSKHKSRPIASTVKNTNECRLRITNRNTQLPLYLSTKGSYDLACQMDEVSPSDVVKSSKEVYSDYSWTLDPATNKRLQSLPANPAMDSAAHKLRKGEGGAAAGLESCLPKGGTKYLIKNFSRLSKELALKFQQPLVVVKELLPHVDCKYIGLDTLCSGVPRPLRTISGGSICKAALARQVYFIKDLLDRGLAPRIMCDGSPDQFASVLITKDGRVAGPYEALTADELVMRVSNRANPSCNPRAPSMLLLTYCYKNGCYIVDLHLTLAKDMSELASRVSELQNEVFATQKMRLKERFVKLPLLPFGFSGGSQAVSGARGFNVHGSRPDDSHYTTLYNQDTSTDENSTLSRMAQEKNIFSVVVNHNKWLARPRDRRFYQPGKLEDFMLGPRVDQELITELSEMASHQRTQGVADLGDDNEENDDEEANTGEAAVEAEEPTAEAEEPAADGYFLCGNAKPKQHKSSLSDRFNHLFHYYGESVQPCGPDEEDKIFAHYSHLPGYVLDNLGNVSYMRGQYKRLMCRPALTFDQEFDLLMAREEARNDIPVDQQTHKKKIVDVVADCDADILRCDQEKVLTFLQAKGKVERLGLDRYPVQWVTQKQIYSYLNHCGLDSLIQALSSLEEKGRLYEVSMESIPSMCQVNMIAAALRIQQKYNVFDGNTSTPLLGPLAEGLVKPVRQKPSPCINRDEDASTCMVRFHVGRLVGLEDYSSHTLEVHPRNQNSFSFPKLSNASNCDLLADIVFGVVVNRIFDPTALSIFALWKHKNELGPTVLDTRSTVLPRRREVEHFLSFICSQSVSLNKQHDVVIPDTFKGSGKEGKRAICRFLRSYASNSGVQCGVLSVRKYLQHLGAQSQDAVMGEGTVHWRTRRHYFFQVLQWSLLEAGSHFHVCGGTSFLVHLVMADLESRFPDLCGKVKIETVHMGHGSNVGIRLCSRHMARKSIRERLKWFHGELIKILLALPQNELALMGYVRIDSVLYSLFTGRIYSYIDTEHILCKVYVLLTISYPSRTISESPFCSSSFTWPLTEECGYWTGEFKKEFAEVIVAAYEAKLEQDSHWREHMLQQYPQQLSYDFPQELAQPIPPLQVQS